MTRMVLREEIHTVYRCDGPYDESGGKPHALVFVKGHDEMPKQWYVLQHGGKILHFCDADCLRQYMHDEHERFLRSLHEELRAISPV